MIKIYLAGPIFNDHDIEIIKKIEKFIDWNGIEFYSPRSIGILQDMSPEERKNSMKRIYDSNIEQMESCTHCIANITERDSGTNFEVGYFAKSGKPIVLFTESAEKMSVMLSECAVGFTTDVKRLLDCFHGYTEEIIDTI